MAIHPTAIVSPKAELAADVEVGPYVIIEGCARIGAGTRIHARAHIGDHTDLGRENEIHIGAIVGHLPQDRKYQGKPSFLKVGDRNIFRENAWVHRGSAEGSSTVIGNDNYFMGGAHVAHNCTIGNGNTIASNALLAGHLEIEDRAYVSGNVVVHQFCRIGRLSFVSGLSAVGKDVPPFVTVGGRPAAVVGLNKEGLKRANIPTPVREALKTAYKLLFRSEMDIAQALDVIAASATSQEERHLVEFIRKSRQGPKARGICTAPRRHAQPGLEADGDEDGLATEEATSLLGMS